MYGIVNDMEFLTSILNTPEEADNDSDQMMTRNMVLGGAYEFQKEQTFKSSFHSDLTEQDGFESYSSDTSTYSPPAHNYDVPCSHFSGNQDFCCVKYNPNDNVFKTESDDFGHPYIWSSNRNAFFPTTGRSKPNMKHGTRKVPEIVRIGATVRERTRMHMLNRAFDDLRKVIPKTNLSDHQKLSKIATLRQAIQYIAAMVSTLKSSGVEIRKVSDKSVGDRRGKRRSSKRKKFSDKC